MIYLSFFRLGVLQTIRNYKSLISLCLFLIICLVIFAHLFTVVPLETKNVSSIQLIWYIALNEWVLIAIPDVHLEIEQDLNKGYLAYRLTRPISYLGSKFFEALGIYFVQLLTLGLVNLLFVSYWSPIFPINSIELILMFIFGCLAGIVAILFQMIVGISAFWFLEVAPIHWIWEKFLFMLGGLFLPVLYFPSWMQTLARLTPFPAILGDRSGLILNFGIDEALKLSFSLLGWTVIALILLNIVYQRGLRILNIEGG